MATYFFSDPHFNHGNIMKYSNRLDFMTEEDYEAFQRMGNKARMSQESVRRMDQGILDGINAAVQPDDVLWCLGDWCFSNRDTYLRDAKSYRDRINCNTINLIWGNHDQFSLRRNVGFETCMDTCKVDADGYEFFLSHYPHVSWDKSHRGVMHLYGHVHGLYQQGDSPVTFPDSWAAFDVGVDTEYRYGVWSATELAERLRTRREAAKLRRD